MKKILYEHHVPTGEQSEYILNTLGDSVELVYGNGFTSEAKGSVACQVEDTGNGFLVSLSEGDVRNKELKEIELDYAQAVNLLAMLLYTHKDYKFTVSSEPEKLN